jgi:hypothetical protein
MKTLIALVLLVSGAQAARACDESMQTFSADCAIQDKYRELRQGFSSLQINIDQIAEYRALRFIARPDWEKAKANGNYDPSLIYQPAPTVWSEWTQGEAFSHETTLLAISLDSIAKIHSHSMNAQTVSTLAALKGTQAGVIREGRQLPPGFTFSCASKEADVAKLQALSSGGYDLKSSSGAPLLKLIYSLPCFDGEHGNGVISYSKSSEVKPTLELLLASMKIDVSAQSRPPVDNMAYYQRWFVAIHPFGDGNGRTSRFLEDILSRHYDMPYVPAGDLQNDVLTAPDEYAAQTRAAINQMLVKLEDCLQQHKAKNASRECEVLH